MKRISWFLPLAFAVLLVAGGLRAQNSASITAGPPLVATFDTVWALINRTYYDTTFLATRWKVLRDSLRPAAERATTNAQLRVVLQALIAGVGVSHFGLIPRELSPALTGAATPTASGGQPGSAGVSLRLADDRLVAWKVDTGGPAWMQGVRPGAEVLRIDQTAVADGIAQLARIEDARVRRQARMTAVMRANAQLAGNRGDTVVIELSEPAGTRGARIARGPVTGRLSRVGNLPPINATVDVSERTVAGAGGARRVGVIAFSVWLPIIADDLNRAFDRFRGADGIIIDLRGNPGGFAGLVSLVAGHVLDSAYTIGTMRQRGGVLQLRANPQRVSPDAQRVSPYAGPLVILMDPLSGSTSELFAAGLQGLGRAHIVGETSAGMALPSLLDRLPNGDVLLHAIADLTDSRGRRVEGVGVIPDEVVPLSAAALATGHDEALEAALRWIARQRR